MTHSFAFLFFPRRTSDTDDTAVPGTFTACTDNDMRSLLSLLVVVLGVCTNAFQLATPAAAMFGRRAVQRLLSMVATKEVAMPALSSTMTEGKIVSWNKKVGDKVSAGDVLLVVESDKADMDVEAFEDGFLAAIYTPEGGSAKVGSAVALLVDSKDDIGKVGGAPPAPAAAAAAPVAPAAAPAAAAAAPVAATSAPAGTNGINMPALSSTMTEGKVVSWGKKVGDKVSSGDMVLVVESDKADMDVESYEEGFLAAILVGDGQTAPVGSPVGLLAATKEGIPAVQAYAAALKSGGAPVSTTPAAAAAAPAAAAPAPATAAAVAVAAPAVVNTGYVAASGFAKAQAKAGGIDLRTVVPSGAHGVITAKDLVGAAAGAPAAASGSAWVPAPGTINATPMARKAAQENGLDVTTIRGTGNFGRVTEDDVLIAAGKKAPPAPKVAAAAAAPAAPAGAPAAAKAGASAAAPVLDGVVAMDGMQKAVAKNMEKTLSVPIFRVSREIVTDKFDELYAALKVRLGRLTTHLPCPPPAVC